ncbi:hypothetical protein GLA29479_4700 [Lysobacter antibioticus]|nr:hypothetical protein GLA29479_4700 [Lysobacter antibioticus]
MDGVAWAAVGLAMAKARPSTWLGRCGRLPGTLGPARRG